MEDFKSYLLSRRLAQGKKAGFYVYWVIQLYSFCSKNVGDSVTKEEIERYLVYLSKHREDWQVDQASEAIQLFLYYKRRRGRGLIKKEPNAYSQWKDVARDMRKVLRLKHRSLYTERTYLSWVRKFYGFINGIPPHSLKSVHVRDFMTHLAVDRSVSVSTQNQAFNAILFFFRHVLGKQIDDIRDAVRAKKKRRLPVVLTRSELDRLSDGIIFIWETSRDI